MVSFSKALVILLAMRDFDRSSGALRYGRRRARADRVGRHLGSKTSTIAPAADKAATTKAATTKKPGGGRRKKGSGTKKGGDDWWKDEGYDDPNKNRIGEPCKDSSDCSGGLPGEQCWFSSTTAPPGGRHLQIIPTGTCECTPGQDRHGCGTGYSCEEIADGAPKCKVLEGSAGLQQPCNVQAQCQAGLRCCYYPASFHCLELEELNVLYRSQEANYCKPK